MTEKNKTDHVDKADDETPSMNELLRARLRAKREFRRVRLPWEPRTPTSAEREAAS